VDGAVVRATPHQAQTHAHRTHTHTAHTPHTHRTRTRTAHTQTTHCKAVVWVHTAYDGTEATTLASSKPHPSWWRVRDVTQISRVEAEQSHERAVRPSTPDRNDASTPRMPRSHQRKAVSGRPSTGLAPSAPPFGAGEGASMSSLGGWKKPPRPPPWAAPLCGWPSSTWGS